MNPEQEKQVAEIRGAVDRFKVLSRSMEKTSGNPLHLYPQLSAALAIIEDLRKQLNAAVLLGQAAASLNKPMTDEEFINRIKCNPAAHVFHAVPKTGFPYTDYVGECMYCGHVPTAFKE